MRRTPILLAGLAAGIVLLGLAPKASANTDPVPPDPTGTTVAQPITSTDMLPSCSLHPNRSDAGPSFTHDPAKDASQPRFLQVFDATDGLLFNGMLAPGASTPALPGAVRVIWSGHAYPISAYALVTEPGPWCVASDTATAPPPTTTPPPTVPPTTVPPTTSITESFLPPATVPPTTEPPTAAPPADATEKTIIPVGVEAVVETREPLPLTGGHPGVLVLLGASLMVMGAAVLTAGRSRILARR